MCVNFRRSLFEKKIFQIKKRKVAFLSLQEFVNFSCFFIRLFYQFFSRFFSVDLSHFFIIRSQFHILNVLFIKVFFNDFFFWNKITFINEKAKKREREMIKEVKTQANLTPSSLIYSRIFHSFFFQWLEKIWMSRTSWTRWKRHRHPQIF